MPIPITHVAAPGRTFMKVIYHAIGGPSCLQNAVRFDL